MIRRTPAPSQDDLPLVSQRSLLRLTAAIIVLALLTVAISMGGRWLGQRMALGGHSENTAILAVKIGEDLLRLPENTIRFAEQRKAGVTDRIDLYLTWPGLQGYSAERRGDFDNIERPDRLIFLQISQSTMSKDMSGRLEPIYAQLFEGAATPFAHGLTLNRLRANSGYGREVILTAERRPDHPYAVRCVIPSEDRKPTSGDCQRDIHVGRDLTVLYRFSSTLLKDWDHIDAAVRSFVQTRLDGAQGASGNEDD
jgi:hypothetical protein